jgi:hypothetical protein
MLIDFFYTLRAAKLPVSVKEFLTLLEAIKAGVVGPNTEQDDASDASVGYKDRRLLLSSAAPRWSRTKSTTTSSTAPLAPTSRASRPSPTSPRTSRWSGCARTWSST